MRVLLVCILVLVAFAEREVISGGDASKCDLYEYYTFICSGFTSWTELSTQTNSLKKPITNSVNSFNIRSDQSLVLFRPGLGPLW